MEYADVLWDGYSVGESDLLEHVQYESAKVVTGAMQGTSKSRLLEELAWKDLKTRRSIHKLVLYFKIVNNFTPSYLSNLLPQTVKQRSGLILRHALNFTLFPVRIERFKRSFFPSTTLLWNSIDYDQRSTLSISVFKQYLNRFFGLSKYNKLFDYSIDRILLFYILVFVLIVAR